MTAEAIAERCLVPWADPPAPRGRIVCIAHIGAGAAAFRSWQGQDPAGLAVWAARLPGRESRFAEPPLESMAAVVDELAAALAAFGEAPVALVGHCSGALVAFELARRLRADGRPVGHLFVVGQIAPHVRPPTPPPPATRDELVALLREMGETDPRILDHEELFAVIEPAVRADLAVLAGYRYEPGPPLDVPITVLFSERDAAVTADVPAWGELTSAGCALRLVAGGHLLLDSADALAGIIRSTLGG
jgi:medium-chain acyl-[acyl-carrier-protein] hydrolase